MWEINGLPVHALVVHGVVVLVPLSALVLALCAWWPAARTRLAVAEVVLAFLAMALVPIATNSGEWLQTRVATTPLVENHAELGDTLAPYVILGFLLAVVIAAIDWRRPQLLTPLWRRDLDPTEPTPTTWDRVGRVAVPVLVLVVGLGTVVQAYRIGDSGAKAVWKNTVSVTPR